MESKRVSGIMLTLLLVGMLTLTFNIQQVKAEPKTWTVDDDGPADFSSIQEAINSPQVMDEDTIYVYNGTYYEHVVVNKSVSLIGENRDTTIVDGNGVGVVLHIKADGVNISRFTVTNSGADGILVDSRYCNIHDNVVSFTGGRGIHLSHLGGNHSVHDNIVHHSGIYGAIDCVWSDNNTVFNNIAHSSPNAWGISINKGNNNVVFNNTVHSNNLGIHVDHSSTNNTLYDNTIFENFVGLLIHQRSSNNSVSGNTITNNTIGILLDNASNNSIYDNTVTANWWYGVALGNSSSNSILRNTITNSQQFGLLSYLSSGNSISGNNITHSDYGIRLFLSSNNSISGNNLMNNDYGIRLSSSSNNRISGNDITNNGYGVKLSSSSNNSVYHNNFIDNTIQVYSSNSTNFWDGGYPAGGNYWSDHIGVDFYWGSYQNLTGKDGIIDTPYFINIDIQDNYPLVKPYVPRELNVSIYTDKYTYQAGDSMHLGLNVTNSDSVKDLCFAIWVELPDSSIHLYMHEHSVVLPIGLNYANPAFDSITLPTIPSGTYTWHAAFLEKATHTIIVEDTAEWQFI